MKTRLALISTALLLSTAAWAEECTTVLVENVRPQQGFLLVAAYTSADSFGKTPAASLRVPAGEARTSVQLCGLNGTNGTNGTNGGFVALRVFQDLDGDGKMAKNLLGLPTEPWGSSGTPGAFGPSWDSGKVALDGKPITVRLSQ
jgi:uncharacterized protein (DUF2141 family)